MKTDILVEVTEAEGSIRGITSLLSDEMGGLWIGSNSSGLAYWHAGKMTRFGYESGARSEGNPGAGC